MNISLKKTRKSPISVSWRVEPRAILRVMNREREQGYTLIETLVALTLVLILSATGLYGWQRWQQSQRLWQTASELRGYLMAMRSDANWHNRDRLFRLHRYENGWCVVADEAVLAGCPTGNPAIFRPMWAGVDVSHITPNLAFFGLRNTAWAGNVTLVSDAGRWTVVISNGGRVRLCEGGAC